MGKIWIETALGKIIHLRVVGADVNTPADAITMPSGVVLQNRCLSGLIEMATVTHGVVTFDFTVPGRVGACNSCGTCCGHPVADCVEPCGYILHEDLNWHVCEHLVINKWRKWGNDNNTQCGIWMDLLDVYKGCLTWPISQAKFDTYTWIQSYCGFSF